jgi:GntR family transcriptional regulator, carbon starvation induced regulator
MDEPAPETRSDWALRRLRSAILTGELPPGARLRAEELAARWHVSPTPLREAFQRLGGARLVEVSPQRGVRVASFTLADAADLYALRLRLEPAALAESMARSDAAHRAAITAAYQRLARARTLEEGTEAHLDFHATLLERCPSPWTRRIIGELAEHAQRYVLLGTKKYRDGRGPVAEHKPLRDTALAGKIDLAVKALEGHLRKTLETVHAALLPSEKSQGRGARRTSPRPLPLRKDIE